MTQQELDTILEQHQHWLNADCEGWEGMRADLFDQDLRGLDFHGANMSGANMSHADMSGANMIGADMSRADMSDVILDDSEKYRLGQILKEPIVGFKKTADGVVITAEIPAGAIVFCINGKKCRTNKAKITDMGGATLLHSSHDHMFTYTLGKLIVIDDFNLMYNVECASGFHFFRTREEAENN